VQPTLDRAEVLGQNDRLDEERGALGEVLAEPGEGLLGDVVGVAVGDGLHGGSRWGQEV